MASPKILFLITEDWYFLSHRLPLARAARDAGYRVAVATRVSGHGDAIRQEGFRLIPLGLRRSGRNPWREFAAILELVRVYRAERPDIVHHVAIKPIIYGSIAAIFSRVPIVINALAGLGYIFSASTLRAGFLRPVVRLALRLLFGRANAHLILQNPDDCDFLIKSGIVQRRQITLIRGSGIDLEVFAQQPLPAGVPVVMLASRLLRDKGVAEFVEAARLLRERGVAARFVLVGDTDEENPSHIPRRQLEAWQQSAVVEWWGKRTDMPKVLASAYVVCLPSYREGLPKVLLEAAAVGRPLVATDVPGCREIVRHNENGLLVPPKNANALAGAIAQLLNDEQLALRFGERSHHIAVAEFSLEQVVAETLAFYRRLLVENKLNVPS